MGSRETSFLGHTFNFTRDVLKKELSMAMTWTLLMSTGQSKTLADSPNEILTLEAESDLLELVPVFIPGTKQGLHPRDTNTVWKLKSTRDRTELNEGVG